MSSALDLARTITDLQARITKLERANNLQYSSVADENGNSVDLVPAVVSANGVLNTSLEQALGDAVADGLVDVFYTTDAPGSFSEGDIWVRQPDQHLFKADMGIWTDYHNQALSDYLVQVRAISNDAQDTANAAQTTAASKSTTFMQSTAPTATGVGDEWFDTSNNYHLWRWNGTAWVDANQASVAYVQSKGTDLVVNGYGLQQNNYNFSSFTFDKTDAPTGAAGSFLSMLAYHVQTLDEIIPVDPAKQMKFGYYIKQKAAGIADGKFYSLVLPRDAYGNTISPVHHTFTVGSTTTLAAPLNPGDTTMTLTSAANWYNGATTTSRGITFWDFVDAGGKAWPIETYSRDVISSPAYGQNGISGNVVTLSVPYAGVAKPAGTPVSNGNNTGGSYMYGNLSQTVPMDWTYFSATVTGIVAPGAAASFLNGWPPGIASASIGWLCNYSTGNQLSQMAVAGVSFSDATAAQDMATAASTLAGTKNKTTAATTAPASPTTGDLWIDTANGNRLTRWSGTAWVVYQDGAIAAASSLASTAQGIANSALTAAQTAQATADGSIRTYYQATAPTGENGTTDIGDLWFNTSNNQASRWNGTTWVLIEDNAIASALAAAQNAQTTADGKITAFYTATAPTSGMSTGDLWYDTGHSNKPYYFNGATWVTVQDATIAVAQTTATTAQTAASGAQSTADQKVQTFWTTSAPNPIVPDADNLMVDPSFDLGVSQVTPVSGSLVDWDNTHSRTGPKSAYVHGGTSATKATIAMPALARNTLYTIMAWVWHDASVPSTEGFRLQYTNTTGGSVTGTASTVRNNQERISISFTTGATGSVDTLSLLTGTAVGTGGWIDDISITLGVPDPIGPDALAYQHKITGVNANQGLAFDGSFYYCVHSQTLYKYDLNWNVVTFRELSQDVPVLTHFSAPVCKDGRVIIPVHAAPNPATIGQWNCSDLSFISAQTVTGAPDTASAAITWDAATGEFIMAGYYANEFTIQRYSTSFAYLGHITTPITFPQGVMVVGDRYAFQCDWPGAVTADNPNGRGLVSVAKDGTNPVMMVPEAIHEVEGCTVGQDGNLILLASISGQLTLTEYSIVGPGFHQSTDLTDGDIWFDIDNDNKATRWNATTKVWEDVPLGNLALQINGIDPSRLSMGIAGNLMQDPSLQNQDIHTLYTGWQILGPDTIYTDYNYFQCTGTTETSSTEWLTGFIPVDAGRTVRIASQIRRDASCLTNIFTTSTRARVRVYFYKADQITQFSSSDQLMEFDLATDTLADTWYVMDASFTVPDGYVYARCVLQTAYQSQGTIDYIKPEIQILWNRVQSDDFIEGEQGWALDSEITQFNDVNVIGDLGADTLSADTSIQIGDNDLLADLVIPRPIGAVSFDKSTTGSASGNFGTTEKLLFRFACGELDQGRMYRIVCFGHLDFQNNDGIADLRFRYTTDGSNPTLSSAVMRAHRFRGGTSGPSTGFYFETIYQPSADYDNVKIALTGQTTGPGGLSYIGGADSTRYMTMYCEDLGTSIAVTTGGALSQKSEGAGSYPSGTTDTGSQQPDPVTTRTKSWSATWTRSYDADGGTRQGDDTPDLYQGYITSLHGNTRSLFGFDYAAIQSALAGATIKKTVITYRVKNAWGSAGIRVCLSTHTYGSKPSTWSGSNVNNDIADWGSQKAGVTYTHDLTGTGVGNGLRDGTIKGLGFGPGLSNTPSAYYGQMYGGTTSGSRPKITITYTK